MPLSAAQEKRALTARDCVTVRHLQHDDSTWHSTLQISPDGRRVAYLLSSPNLQTNQNETELYVRKLPSDPENSGKRLLVGELSAVRWLSDSTHLILLMKEHGQRVIGEVDSRTGEHSTLIRGGSDITEYSIDRRGTTAVYATDAPSEAKEGLSQQEIASGYRLPFQTSADASWPARRLFVIRRTASGWTAPTPITIRSPLSRQTLAAFTHAANSDLQPTLSPDGQKLLLNYWDLSDKMPDEWRESGFMQFRNSAGVFQALHLLVLYDLPTGETSLPLKTPWVYSAPLWSSDSRSFVVAAQPAIGTELERENVKTRLIGHSAGAHLFCVEVGSGKTQDVASKLAYPWEGPLFWGSQGELLVRTTSMDSITRFFPRGNEWQAASSFEVPLHAGDQITTDDNYVVGEFSDTTTPPQLFVCRPGDKQVQVFAKLNPQFDALALGQPKELHWKTSTGFDATGLLLLPPNYQKGVRYPLVIQTKPFATAFVCSFGNFPSFAPQPIANAGIMYLGQIPTKGSLQREEDYFPTGNPGYQGAGGVAEAAFANDLWDSAVRALDEQGLVDPDRIGIIGFSRTGWYTEFILSHSKVHYRAATVADNVQYSLGEYWLAHDASTIKSYDSTYGGPPYGATLRNWLENSISFNLDKIHTPLLMEEMGYGMLYSNPNAPPISLAATFEVFTGLNRLSKPVELYYYPNESHTPEHPQARLATMQRNVDWYRFWLQEYERANPEDPQQYIRWRSLRELEQEDAKKAALQAFGSVFSPTPSEPMIKPAH